MSNQEITLREKFSKLVVKYYLQVDMIFFHAKIATASGVSATSIYLYFKNKDHLVHTIIEESVEELSTVIETKASQVDGTIEKFESIIQVMSILLLISLKNTCVIYTIKSKQWVVIPKKNSEKLAEDMLY